MPVLTQAQQLDGSVLGFYVVLLCRNYSDCCCSYVPLAEQRAFNHLLLGPKAASKAFLFLATIIPIASDMQHWC